METSNADEAPGIPAAPFFTSEFCAPSKRRLVLIAAIVASAMSFIDASVTSIAIPAMRETLDASLAQVQWINNAYLLALSALVLVGGAFGDRFGLARIFGAGITFFVLASIACALAPSVSTLIGARGFQGVGAAMMVPSSLAVIARAYPAKERAAAIGTWAAASAIATAAGPIIGGLALTFGGPEMWRVIFAVNLPFGAIALWCLWNSVENDVKQSGKRPDILGAVTAATGMALLTWGLTIVQETPAIALVYIASGIAVMVVFLWLQAARNDPMVDLALFKIRVFNVSNIGSFFLYFSLSTITFFLPMVLITAWGESEINAAAAFAPLSVFIGGLSRRVGVWSGRYGERPFIAAGSLLVATAFALLAFWVQEQSLWTRVLPAMCLMGLGMSFVVSPLSSAVMGSVDQHQTGTASGVNNAISRLAGLMAIAAMGSVASMAYVGFGGSDSFGAEISSAENLMATNRAFILVALGASAMAGLASITAWFGLPAKKPEDVQQSIGPT